MPDQNKVPSVGRIVHFVLRARQGMRPSSVGEHRPAIIVRVWSPEMVQLQVFTDGFNDIETGDPVIWETSIHNDETEKKPGTWHWCEYVTAVWVKDEGASAPV